jgi:hypothetical protein
MTTPDALSDALVTLLQAVLPTGGVVLDHEPLPMKNEDLPDVGLLGVYLFEDAPEDESGLTDSVFVQPRIATFKIEGRIPKSAHLLHSTKGLRGIVPSVIGVNPTLGGLATDSRLGSLRILVHESSSTIGAFVQDLRIHYLLQPE